MLCFPMRRLTGRRLDGCEVPMAQQVCSCIAQREVQEMAGMETRASEGKVTVWSR